MQDTTNALIESNSAHADVVTKTLDLMFDYGVEFERERIIKLLEGFDPRTAIGDLLPLLIKGENK
jgi:hypothetical protein